MEGQKYPDSTPRVSPSGRWLDGTWIMGNNYHASAPLYGAYPPRYLDRILSLCPGWQTQRILHVFSGAVPSGRWVRVDSIAERQPYIRADAVALPFQSQSFDLILADPPYSEEDATKYSVKMVNRKAAIEELGRVATPGATLVWLDVQLPMFRKDMWRWMAAITIIRSTNHRVRLASFFERTD